MKRGLAFSILAFVLLVLGLYAILIKLISLQFVDYGDPNERPPMNVAAIIKKPVFYPKARNSTQREVDIDVRAGTVPLYEQASFTTTDEPTAVVTFYRDSLLKNNWRLDEDHALSVRFLWDYPRQVDDGYYFSIECTWAGESNGNTRVTECEIVIQSHQ